MAAVDRSQASVLGVLADLSPSAQQRSSALTVPLDWFRWLPASGVSLFQRDGAGWRGDHLAATARLPSLTMNPAAQAPPAVPLDRRTGERLAAIDRIRSREQRSLRAGWLFVAGRRPLGDGRLQRVFSPLLSVPVRIVLPPVIGKAVVTAAGDVAVNELVTDPGRRHELEATYELGGGALDGLNAAEIPPWMLGRLDRLRRFGQAAAHAAGLEVSGFMAATAGPEELLRAEGLTLVAGVGLFTAHEVGGLSAAASLRSWAGSAPSTPTAFSALYLGSDDEAAGGDTGSGSGVATPFPLTPIQRKVVSDSQVAPVSVVSGAAGTGKSHTVSAIACDAVGRGETVLVAAKTEAAVDALLVLLRRAPGLEPVVFGSSERRDELARRLAAGELRPASKDDLAAAEIALHDAVTARSMLAASICTALEAEIAFQGDDAWDGARLLVPGCFDPRCDLGQVRRLLAAATETSGWWARRRARRALAQAASMAGATRSATPSELRAAVNVAASARAAADLFAAGGLNLASDWARLEALDDEVHRRVSDWLAVTSRKPERLNRSSLEAVAVLSTALRSGRAARRDQLARLDARLTRALPLWVGTLSDIEDLLPPTAALFDLVILDEASAIDQPLAAPALLRARRAVVVGDPHQLRHVSFLADDQLRQAAEDHGLSGDPVLVGRLDVRRNSIFDVAVGVTTATVLDEHFRSAPHLIDFVARRLYGGRLQVATRSPRTEASDCIEVIRMSGERDAGGVVRSEVDKVIELLGRMLRAGRRSVGVLSPFRAQADALEAAALEAFTLAELDALDLRVGTAHAFQGNERDVVLVSLGIGAADTATTWRFAEDPHLFAVLATRARHRLVLLLSAEPPVGGLLAGYVAQADAPPGRPRPAGAPGPWVESVAEWLSEADLPTLAFYPTGRHAVDVCLGDRQRFLGLECSVHPDGPAAHIDRHLALRRAGWELADAYRSRWGDRRGELLVELSSRLQTGARR